MFAGSHAAEQVVGGTSTKYHIEIIMMMMKVKDFNYLSYFLYQKGCFGFLGLGLTVSVASLD